MSFVLLPLNMTCLHCLQKRSLNISSIYITVTVTACGQSAQWQDVTDSLQVLVVRSPGRFQSSAWECCRENGGRLVRIDTEDKDDAVNSKLNGT